MQHLFQFFFSITSIIILFQARCSVTGLDDNKEHQNLSPEITLKYSCFKNLGNLYMKSKKFEEASKYYLKVGIIFNLLECFPEMTEELLIKAFLHIPTSMEDIYMS